MKTAAYILVSFSWKMFIAVRPGHLTNITDGECWPLFSPGTGKYFWVSLGAFSQHLQDILATRAHKPCCQTQIIEQYKLQYMYI